MSIIDCDPATIDTSDHRIVSFRELSAPAVIRTELPLTAVRAQAVQRVSGTPYVDYVTENILKPLDMQHATFVEPLPDALKNERQRPCGHCRAPGISRARSSTRRCTAGSTRSHGKAPIRAHAEVHVGDPTR